jgi:hypothetical protein
METDRLCSEIIVHLYPGFGEMCAHVAVLL